MKKPRLSKSRYLSGCQCPLKLWFDCYERQFATPANAAQQAIFDTGTAVGELARDHYPGGRLVKFDYFHSDEALAQTARFLDDPTVPAIFEGAFTFRDIGVRVDVLERTATGWNLVEVKSATRFKQGLHAIDVSVQLWVLRGAGVAIDNSAVLTLNRDYRYDGVSLDLDQLFRLWDCSEIAETLLPQVEQNAAAFTRMLGEDTAPVIFPGEQCFTPYDCAYYAHCTRNLVLPEHPITDLPNISRKARERMRADGKNQIPQVPDDFPLTQLQKRVWKAVATNAEYISNDLGDALRTIRYPVYHLDFETFMLAIPRYAGTRPYDAIPFQYSLHIENTGGSIEHVEYLHTEDSDPRELVIVSLIEALGDEGSVCVYSSYEKQVLGKLANEFPQYAESLRKISTRLWDLLPVVRDHYYHAGFHGSFSIKKVLPVLLPNLGYDDLEIKDGQMAGVSYLKSLAMVDLVERERIYTALKMYCGMDTVAMLRLRARLLEIHEKFSQR